MIDHQHHFKELYSPLGRIIIISSRHVPIFIDFTYDNLKRFLNPLENENNKSYKRLFATAYTEQIQLIVICTRIFIFRLVFQ